MRYLLLAAVLAAGPFGAVARAEDGPEPMAAPRATVRLVWSDPGLVLPGGFAEIGREVRDVFRPLGVEILWRRSDQRAASSEELNVVFLPRDTARAAQHEAMGRVLRERSTALWIYAEPVRRTLGLGPRVVQVSLRELCDYPRALGRVVAHELVHAIVPDEPHAPRGLMQASLNVSPLTAPHLRMDERCAQAVLLRLAARRGEEPDGD